MERQKGPRDLSPEAEAAIRLFKKNVQKRLDRLHVSPTTVGQRVGKGYSWLRDIMESDRYEKKISLNLVADIAKALGVAPWSLLSPKYRGAGEIPRWYVKNPPLDKRATDCEASP